VDGVTWREYEKILPQRVAELHRMVHVGAFRATPSRRVYIESYDNGVITVQHEGYTYKATGDPSSSLYDLDDLKVPTRYDTAIELVGHEVRPFDGKQRDTDGRFVIMWNVGARLEFKISSVTKTPC
jgi:hypothetical protein